MTNKSWSPRSRATAVYTDALSPAPRAELSNAFRPGVSQSPAPPQATCLRVLRRLNCRIHLIWGFAKPRSTPGYMLAPASQAGFSNIFLTQDQRADLLGLDHRADVLGIGPMRDLFRHGTNARMFWSSVKCATCFFSGMDKHATCFGHGTSARMFCSSVQCKTCLFLGGMGPTREARVSI